MDPDSSTKFIGSLTKFLQSLCNGYVEFEDGVELIGHIYLSVDGKSGKKIDYILNEKVCKSDNSVTFISNSFHALPEAKAKAASGKEGDAKKDDGEVSDSGDSIPKSTNTGTIPSRASQSSRSAPSPTQNRSGVQTGTKRPGSPLKGPTPPQRRAPTPPSQRRIQSSAAKGSAGSPASKTVPSSPSSSSQDNIPSPSPARKNRIETSQPPSNQSDNAGADNESDSLVPPNIMSINPPPDFASFLGSLTSDNQTSARDQRSPQRDTKPDTDVTFIKEEFVSEPSSCAQAGSSGQHSGRSGDEHLDSSGLYPVMLHQNTSVFPSTSAGYPPGFPGGASATATSQQPGFPGTSTSQSDLFNPVPGTSQDGADPSGLAPNMAEVIITGVKRLSQIESAARQTTFSQLPVASQTEPVPLPRQGDSTPGPTPTQLQAEPRSTPSSSQVDTACRDFIHFRVVSRSEATQLTGQSQPPRPSGSSSAFSQLESILQSPLPMAPFPQHIEPTSTVGANDRLVHHSVRQFLIPQVEPIPSTSRMSPHQQQPQQVTPSSTRGQGYPLFGQPQFPPRSGVPPMGAHSPRLSPIDPMVHSSTPQFPYPQGQQRRDPGKGFGEKKDYNCLECGKVFKSQQALGYHRNAKHGHREDLKCPLCGKMLSHKQHKNYHLKHVHGIDEYIA